MCSVAAQFGPATPAAERLGAAVTRRMCDPSVEERLGRLNKALVEATKLTDDTHAHWENRCEGAFSTFRVTVVHLRREQEALDSVDDKAGAWRFIVKFCRARPFLHDRCNEVLRILMKSDLWMKAFADDPELSLDGLPPSIVDEMDKRVKEVCPEHPGKGAPANQPADGPGPSSAAGSVPSSMSPALRPANMAVVVQRCTKAKILVDERAQMWGKIGRGLVISVSFTKGANEEAVHHAARFLLTAKLSTRETWEPGSGGGYPDTAPRADCPPESVAELCRRGDDQGVLVLPQDSLVSELSKDNTALEYSHLCPKDAAQELYKAFVAALRSTSETLAAAAGTRDGSPKELRVVAGSFHGRQYLEMQSAGPFMHAFNF